MDGLRHELRRLGRAFARVTGGRRAARVHVGLLVAAFVLACIHRMVRPLPGMAGLEGRWGPTLLVAALLLAVGPLLARLLVTLARKRPDALARELDDRFAWRDETHTAWRLALASDGRPLTALLVAQAVGRLREVPAAARARAGAPARWPRVALVLLFAFVLLAPGVSGLFGDVGRARDGSTPAEDEALAPTGPPRPMRADLWLQGFVEDPLPVEPLPAEDGGSAGADGGPR